MKDQNHPSYFKVEELREVSLDLKIRLHTHQKQHHLCFWPKLLSLFFLNGSKYSQVPNIPRLCFSQNASGPLKTDADISVGGKLQWLSRWQWPGAASCLYDEVTNTATVVNSHWLPAQTGLYVDGYQPVTRVPRSPAGESLLTAAAQVGTWKWNPGADLWTSDASWLSASVPLVWLRDVSRHPESWDVFGQVEAERTSPISNQDKVVWPNRS